METITYRDLGQVGRLGNALFQYAATMGIAFDQNARVMFPHTWMHRPFFNIPEELYGAPSASMIEATTYAKHIDRRVRAYLQDVALFKSILPLLRVHLAPSLLAQETLNGPECEGFQRLTHPILSVHVRRGDNVLDPGVPQKWRYMLCPPLSYYREAIDLISSHYTSIACFSDDPEWCEQHLGREVDYVHHGVPHPKEDRPDFRTAPVHDWPELFMMARSSGHVISGSTYGVWGALLADSPEVVHSWPVYGPALDFIDASLLFLPEWKQLEHAVGPAC